MTMIRTKWDRAQIAGLFTPLLFTQDSIHHRHHIDVAAKVRRLVEGFRVCFTAGRAQMGKMDVIASVSTIFTRSLSARTPYDPVHMVKPLLMLSTVSFSHCISSMVDTIRGRPRIGRGGSSGCTARAGSLTSSAYRHDGAQEIGHIFTQLCFINVVVLRQTRAELVKGVALFRSRQAGDDIASQFIDICFAHRLEIDLSLTLLFFTVIRFRSRAFKDMQLKGGESDLIETQRPGAVRQLIFQIGARPVEDRHKVVAHGIDAAGREVADALLIVGNPGRILPAVGFNILVDGMLSTTDQVNPLPLTAPDALLISSTGHT